MPSNPSSFQTGSAGNNLPSGFSQVIQTLETLIQNFMPQLLSIMRGGTNPLGSGSYNGSGSAIYPGSPGSEIFPNAGLGAYNGSGSAPGPGSPGSEIFLLTQV